MLRFVPVESEPAPTTRPTLEVPLAAVEPAEPWDGRVSLFGDLER